MDANESSTLWTVKPYLGGDVQFIRRFVLGLSPPRERHVCVRTFAKYSRCVEMTQDVASRRYFHLKDTHLAEILGFRQHQHHHHHTYDVLVLEKCVMCPMHFSDLYSYVTDNGQLNEKLIRKLFLQMTLVMDCIRDKGYPVDIFFIKGTLLDENVDVRYVHNPNSCFELLNFSPFIIVTQSTRHLVVVMGKVLYFLITGVFVTGMNVSFFRNIERTDIDRLEVSHLCRQMMTGLILEELKTTRDILDHDWMKQSLQ